jgi:type IV pilus assembly protein PilY1
MKTITAITLMVSLIFLVRSPALADDSDLFGANIEPNVMLLIDSSGSMKSTITSSIYAPATTYSGTSYSSSAVYSGTTNDYTLYKNTVDEVANSSARNSLSTVGFWVGQIGGSTVSLFLGNYLNYRDCTTCSVLERKIDIARRVYSNIVRNVEGVRFGVMRLRKKGGEIVSPIGTDRATMAAAIENMDNFGDVGTALGDELYDAGRYFKGTFDYPDGSSFASPLQLECQPNFIILMSDGRHNSYDRDVRDEATLRFTEDHSSSLAGDQNAIVHTIGFDLSEGDDNDLVANDVLITAAANGGGSFFSANNSAELELALVNAIRQVIPGTFSFTNPVIPSTSATGSTRAYIASFKSDEAKPFWRGFLKAYERDPNNGEIRLLADDTPDPQYLVWDAGQKLSAKSAADRTIYTVVNGKWKEFTKSESSMGKSDLGVSTNAERDKIIDFIRGIDATDEDGDGNTTEERDWKLGDIFHSTAVLVSPPLMPLAEKSYVDFKNANSGRTTVVIVGANDGMLHAFRESDGEELWAFVPPDLLGSLNDLTVQSGKHRFYVDSSPIAADIKVNEGNSEQWKTIVVFGLRKGGKSYYALDITDTEDPKFLWSFTDSKMGESWSEPAIGQVDKANGKYAAFVGGGYDSDSNNSSGKAFFVIDLKTGGKLWEYYNDGSSGDRNYMNFSLAANPTAADLNNNGFIDRVYIGDVGGQLWKFDVSGAISGSTTVTSYTYEFLDKDSVTLQRDFTKKIAAGTLDFLDFKLASDVVGATPPLSCSTDCYAYAPNGGATDSVAPGDLGYVGGLNFTVYGSDTKLENLTLISENSSTSSGDNWTGKRFFAADSSQTNPPPAGEYFPAQAIYGAPALSLDDKGNLWTHFGTGDRDHLRNVSTNRFYGIKDTNPAVTLTESDLLQVTSSVTSVDSSVQGWFFTLGSNEKVLAAADVFNSIVFFSSFTPTDAAACGSGGGTAKLYAVQTVTGFAALNFTTGDALASTDGSVTRATIIGTGVPSRPTVIIDSAGNPSVITGTSNQEIDNNPLPPVSRKYLIGWREVF